MKAAHKAQMIELCHKHTNDIDSLDGSNFFNVPEYLYPQWLHSFSEQVSQPARKILSECIRYRNSMAFQKAKDIHQPKKGKKLCQKITAA